MLPTWTPPATGSWPSFAAGCGRRSRPEEKVKARRKPARGIVRKRAAGRPATMVSALMKPYRKSVLCLLLWGLMSEAQGAQSESPQAPGTESKEDAQLLRLSFKEAIGIALAPEGNVRARLAAESFRQARARAGQARAALLPRIEASVGEQNLTRNLEAFGIRLNIPVPG